MLAGKARHATHMIIVLMCHNDAVDIVRREIKTLQSPCGIGQAKTTIQHETGVARLNHQRVTFAAAAQRRKTHAQRVRCLFMWLFELLVEQRQYAACRGRLLLLAIFAQHVDLR